MDSVGAADSDDHRGIHDGFNAGSERSFQGLLFDFMVYFYGGIRHKLLSRGRPDGVSQGASA